MESNRIHFIHANGFPPNSYKSLLNDININIQHFNLNQDDYKDKKIDSWIAIHDCFIKSIKKYNNIIGIGHSVGGNIILRSALTNPHKFSKIILLDPTLFIPRIIYGWLFFSKLGLEKKIHPFLQSTLNKKMTYNNYEDIFKSYRNKKVFSKINDENLNIYIQSITKKINDKIYITYSKNWEYMVYKTGLIADLYIWKNIKNLKIPCLIIKAEDSNAFLNSSKIKILKLNPKIELHTIKNSSHLFPLEFPEKTAEIIKNFI